MVVTLFAATATLTAPARAGLNSADWANILGAVVEVAGSAAAGYAAAQQAQAEQQAAEQRPDPTIFYTGYYMKPYGVKVCQYTDGSELAIDKRSECPAYF